jgi:hypothetical protein
MITIGSIVSLHGRKYKVYEVQVRGHLVVPRAVKSVDSSGREDFHLHKDLDGSWFIHTWELISSPTPIDPKARIIAKIKYLDEKFKAAQEKKKAALKAAESLKEMTTSYTSSDVIWGSTSGLAMSSPAALIRTTPMNYNEFMEYYNRMQEAIAQRTPY